MSRQMKHVADCVNPPMTPKNGPIQLAGHHNPDCDCAWVRRQATSFPDTHEIKDSWLAAHAYINKERGRQAANLWLLENANLRFTCPGCGTIETPRIEKRENGGITRLRAACPGCGKLFAGAKS